MGYSIAPDRKIGVFYKPETLVRADGVHIAVNVGDFVSINADNQWAAYTHDGEPEMVLIMPEAIPTMHILSMDFAEHSTITNWAKWGQFYSDNSNFITTGGIDNGNIPWVQHSRKPYVEPIEAVKQPEPINDLTRHNSVLDLRKNPLEGLSLSDLFELTKMWMNDESMSKEESDKFAHTIATRRVEIYNGIKSKVLTTK